MIPDPARPARRSIPAPGVYAPDASAIANEGQFDGVGTIRIADSTARATTSPTTTAAAIANDGSGTLIIERIDHHRTTRARPPAAASTPPAAR